MLHALQHDQGLLSYKEKHEVRSAHGTLINLSDNVKETLANVRMYVSMRIYQLEQNKDYDGALVMGVPSTKMISSIRWLMIVETR